MSTATSVVDMLGIDAPELTNHIEGREASNPIETESPNDKLLEAAWVDLDPQRITDGISSVYLYRRASEKTKLYYVGYHRGEALITNTGRRQLLERFTDEEFGVPTWYVSLGRATGGHRPAWLPDAVPLKYEPFCACCGESAPLTEMRLLHRLPVDLKRSMMSTVQRLWRVPVVVKYVRPSMCGRVNLGMRRSVSECLCRKSNASAVVATGST